MVGFYQKISRVRRGVGDRAFFSIETPKEVTKKSQFDSTHWRYIMLPYE